METLVENLRKLGISLSTCESVTGGLFAAKITAVPGASEVFKGSLIVYQNDSKKRLLNISLEDIKQYGVVSSEVATQMALNTAKLLESDLVVSFTGDAGPSVQDKSEIGRVYIGYYYQEKVYTKKHLFKGNRADIKEQCIEAALMELKQMLHIPMEDTHGR